MWYWEGVYHLLRDTNCCMQFWCWRVSVFPYLIPLPLYICVCLTNKKKILNVVESSHIGKVWYWERVYHLLRDTNCCMQFWCWHVSVFPCLIPLPLYVCVCVCVCLTNEKRYSMLSSHPTSVRCDIENGFITCSVTLTVACNFGVGVWVYSLVSSPFPYIYMCVCVNLFMDAGLVTIR